MSDAVEWLGRAAAQWETDGWPSSTAFGEHMCKAIREVLARLDKAECNEGCVGVEEYDRVLAEVERVRADRDKWLSRFTEISEPGSLGAFAARDELRARVEAALAALGVGEVGTPMHPEDRIDNAVKALRGGDDG